MENTTYSNIEKIADEAPWNIENKELETLIIASTETLKRQKMKCGIDDFSLKFWKKFATSDW